MAALRRAGDTCYHCGKTWLSGQQQRVAQLQAQGLTRKQIAHVLGVHRATVYRHVQRAKAASAVAGSG